MLMQELVRLRQQQQATDGQLQAMVQRLQGMEQRQQQMMSFLAKAMNSPGFLAQFVQPKDSGRRITESSKKRRLKQDGVSDDVPPLGSSDGQIVKYQPMMNEAATAMLRQIMKFDSSPGLENFGNACTDGLLIGNGSSSSNVLDCSSAPNHVSGVTLQEVVPPTSLPVFIPSEIKGCSSAAVSDAQSPTVGAPTEMMTNQIPVAVPISLPPPDAIIPELSRMVSESNNAVMMGPTTQSGALTDPMSLEGIDRIPFEIGEFSPDPQMEWEDNLLDDIPELPGVSDPFWEKFLQSPPPAEAEMDLALTDDLPKQNETRPLENGWDKSQHMAELTEQLGLLSSDARKD